MIKFILLWCMGFLGACVHTTPRPTNDTVINFYIEEFYKDFPYGLRVEVYIERSLTKGMSNQYNGLCMVDSNIVLISQESVGRFNTDQIKYLIYHELGHCALDLPHNTTVIMRGSPFPRKFRVQDVVEMREYHRQVCRGNPPGVRRQLFGPKELTHESCFHGALVGEG